MAIEIPRYEVMKKESNFELRNYSNLILAETIVDNNFDESSNIGFRRLAGYIFGGNTSKQKIAMTTPVGQELRQGKFVISFTMPSNYTIESLPVPDDKNVSLKALGKREVAAIIFSGTWSQSRYEAHLVELKKWIKLKNLKVINDPIFARYNPPWTPWFMRRNEILIEVSTKN